MCVTLDNNWYVHYTYGQARIHHTRATYGLAIWAFVGKSDKWKLTYGKMRLTQTLLHIFTLKQSANLLNYAYIHTSGHLS